MNTESKKIYLYEDCDNLPAKSEVLPQVHIPDSAEVLVILEEFLTKCTTETAWQQIKSRDMGSFFVILNMHANKHNEQGMRSVLSPKVADIAGTLLLRAGSAASTGVLSDRSRSRFATPDVPATRLFL